MDKNNALDANEKLSSQKWMSLKHIYVFDIWYVMHEILQRQSKIIFW